MATSESLVYRSLPIDSNTAWDPSAASTLAWPMPSDDFGAPCIVEEPFELVVAEPHKKAELEAVRGRIRGTKDSDQNFKSNHDGAGGLSKMKSIGADFGTNFLKSQVNKKRTMNEECSVTVHDYGKEHYHLNGSPFQKEASQDKAVPKYTDRIQLAEAIPVLTKRRPEWANVRFVFPAPAQIRYRYPTHFHQPFSSI